MPNIPSSFENVEIVTDYSLCTPFDENDVVPNIQLRTPFSLSLVIISEEKMIEIIRALDPNKSSGWDGLSPHDKDL